MPLMSLVIPAIIIIVAIVVVKSGFFALKATCAICGKKIGLNRYKQGGSGKDTIWTCPTCAKTGGLLVGTGGGGALHITSETEYKMKCDVCSIVYCFTAKDIERNIQRAKQAKMASVGTIASAVAGHYAAGEIGLSRADSYLNNIVDYNRCPKCNSSSVHALSDEEWEKEKATMNTPQASTTAVSSADELKKFKELLDNGVISQAEFDAKKKQLLGL